MSFGIEDPDFKKAQLKVDRVSVAFEKKWPELSEQIQSIGIDPDSINIYIRAFKFEEDLEIWAKHKDSAEYSLLRSYKFCSNVGYLGPKTRQGDKQIPEGIYSISEFNNESNYLLSLKVNYPNLSDSIRNGPMTELGGMIYIHGGCHTVGCIPITDDKIMDLYVLAVQAANAGQDSIPVHIYPARLTEENFDLLNGSYLNKHAEFWTELKAIYDVFEKHHVLPEIITDPITGKYAIH